MILQQPLSLCRDQFLLAGEPVPFDGFSPITAAGQQLSASADILSPPLSLGQSRLVVSDSQLYPREGQAQEPSIYDMRPTRDVEPSMTPPLPPTPQPSSSPLLDPADLACPPPESPSPPPPLLSTDPSTYHDIPPPPPPPEIEGITMPPSPPPPPPKPFSQRFIPSGPPQLLPTVLPTFANKMSKLFSRTSFLPPRAPLRKHRLKFPVNGSLTPPLEEAEDDNPFRRDYTTLDRSYISGIEPPSSGGFSGPQHRYSNINSDISRSQPIYSGSNPDVSTNLGSYRTVDNNPRNFNLESSSTSFQYELSDLDRREQMLSRDDMAQLRRQQEYDAAIQQQQEELKHYKAAMIQQKRDAYEASILKQQQYRKPKPPSMQPRGFFSRDANANLTGDDSSWFSKTSRDPNSQTWERALPAPHESSTYM